MRVYLDWNATTPLRDEARLAMHAAMDVVGNPSSVHAEGRSAKAIVERAREQVARAIGCKASEVIFTSGATEGAMALAGLDVAVEPTAHDCLWSHRRAAQEDTAQEDTAQEDTVAGILAIGVANGETGALTEVPAKDEDGLFHTAALSGRRLFLDAVQAFGKLPFSFSWSGADMAILSAHKLGGPKGVGALILREGIEIKPLSTGGGQELGRRSGTENVIGIAGFGAAAEAAAKALDTGVWHDVATLRDRLEARILSDAPSTTILAQDKQRLPNTTLIAVPGWKGETQVMQMDLAGFAVSAGSACSSGKVKESRVLKAIGCDDATASCAIRVSLGPTTTADEVDRFAGAWLAKYAKFGTRAA